MIFRTATRFDSTADAPEVRLWRFNVGFYNLFLALGLIAGFVTLHLGHETVGRTLIINLSFFMVGGGIMLFVSDPELWRGSLGQALPPAVVLPADVLQRGAYGGRKAIRRMSSGRSAGSRPPGPVPWPRPG
ncbi:DUF1304 domain-containing protein [Streptomyces sp. OZ13]|uniref:DUF1304 domain-containing protein n=1 Tax=Streptomyces sp. OZ13 TaxID=3452210 RepID=UPI003F8A5F27